MHFPLFTTVTENNTAMGEHVKYKITNENLTIQLQSWSIIQNRNSDVGKTQGQLKSQAKPTLQIKPQINKPIETTITLLNPSNTHVGYREWCLLMLRLRNACLGYMKALLVILAYASLLLSLLVTELLLTKNVFQDRQQRDIMTVRDRLEELEENQKHISDLLANTERPGDDLRIS